MSFEKSPISHLMLNACHEIRIQFVKNLVFVNKLLCIRPKVLQTQISIRLGDNYWKFKDL